MREDGAAASYLNYPVHERHMPLVDTLLAAAAIGAHAEGAQRGGAGGTEVVCLRVPDNQ